MPKIWPDNVSCAVYIYQILVQRGLCASTTDYHSFPAVEIMGWMDFLLVAILGGPDQMFCLN